MSSSKVTSINKYTVGNISKISTNTSITKRPYDNTSFSSGKRDEKSKSFKNTLKSSTSKESSDDKTDDFASLLSNELNDRLILDSRETLRVIHTNFDNTHSTETNSNPKTDSPELHAKLRDAMKVEVDTSEIYKKLQLLKAIKADSNK
ncbi:hypothetical protein [Clostridium sp.]|uniref:hypothetical protein n=1 Tax=Clostridium sp. TaxID=1506 RepID=UPI00284652AB|nr:hypothetical protein [Clostridium sp.]MDR3596907.1 hypothetical protein [Clostridium sp.]